MMRCALATIALAACHAAPAAPGPAAPTTALPAAGAPCFPDRAALDGPEVFKQLEKHGMMFQADEPGRPTRSAFGTCTVGDGLIRDAGGATVAEINCGLRILVPGIRDDLGLALGAHGQEVLARLPAAHGTFICRSNGPGQVRCNPERREEDDTDASWYVVAGDLPAGTDVLTGAAAEAFFAPLVLVEIDMSVWCH